MSIELRARTAAGARFVGLATALAADLATRAAEHDRTGTYPVESLAALRDAGFLTAPIPEEHGGLGVETLHDVVLGSVALARGDASVTIGVNMHFAALLNVVRRWRMAVAAGDERRAAGFGSTMEDVARRGVVMAAAVSEPGQDLTRPRTTATKTGDGWRVDGHKVFCTMSPAATALYTSVTYQNGSGPRYGYAMIPADAPGVVIHDDWDALGMRASGSNSVSFEGVELPAPAVRGGFPVGDAYGYLDRNLPAGLFHAAASLGIAEGAWAHARHLVGRREVGGHALSLAAQAAIDLGAARATLSRAAAAIDEHHEDHPADPGTEEEVLGLFAGAQAAKAFVCEASARIVDRSMTLAGGGGYRSTSPLARAYRDVRAGSFMHPLAMTRAHDFVGTAALGRTPEIH